MPDLLTTFSFHVELDGVDIGIFKEASGLVAETEIIGLLAWSWRDLSLTAVGTAIARWGWREGFLFGALNLFILAAMCWRWSLILRQLQFPDPRGIQ